MLWSNPDPNSNPNSNPGGEQAITAYTGKEHSACVDSSSNSFRLCDLGLNVFEHQFCSSV